jgi:hypothetical protein
MHTTLKFWAWVAVMVFILLVLPNFFIQTRTGWVTVYKSEVNMPAGTMCTMAIQENMHGLPLPALMAYGTNGCSAPYKKINLFGLPVDLLIAYGIIRGVFAYKNRHQLTV